MTPMTKQRTQAEVPGGTPVDRPVRPLPAPDMTLPSIAPDGLDGAHFYRASTVADLLEAERALLRGLAVELDSLLRAHETQGDGLVPTSQVRASVEPYLAA